MNVGILGSGNMGKAVGVRLALSGSQVFFGARTLDKAAEAAALAGYGARSGSLDEAARFGEVLLWTMRETDPAKVLDDPSLLDGKILIDLNNRDYATEARTGGWFGASIAEQLQERAPTASVVKAFNTLAMESFDIAPEALRRAGAQTFIAGNNGEAKQQVVQLAEALGLEAVDVGSGPGALRAVEALGDIIRLLMIDGGRGGQAHLRLVTLPPPTLGAIGKRDQSSYA